jgi:hypothetical protein
MFTEIVHIPIGVRLLLKLMLPLPATAVTVPPHVLVTPGVAATCNPAGSVSVKLPLMATTLGLLMLKFTVVTPFTGINAAPKLLVICGGSKMMMPTFAVPPLEAPNPAVLAVYVNVVGVALLTVNVPL